MENAYYLNYQTLSTRALKQMLAYERIVEGDKSRFDTIRYLLSQKRFLRFRVGKTYVEKEL